MPIDTRRSPLLGEIPRQIFRFTLVPGFALCLSYGLSLPLPYMAPMFAVLLAARPGPPPGPKALGQLLMLVIITLGCGIAVTPFLLHYPVTAFLLVGTGLFFANYLGLEKGQGLVAVLLAAGLTLISAAGTVSSALAIDVIQTLVLSIVLVIVCQWAVYPFFPELPGNTTTVPAPDRSGTPSSWISLRAALIVLPAYLMALTNPSMYLPMVMKSLTLGQQSSYLTSKTAGRELLGSTFTGGGLAVLLWFLLSLWPCLWMFFLWILVFLLFIATRIYGLWPSSFTPSFWNNTAVTLIILLGPSVQDTATGKDVYMRFSVRMGLFIFVTLYAWAAIFIMDSVRSYRLNRQQLPNDSGENLSMR